MEELVRSLSRAVEGAPALALAASFAWGLLSILLSPCCLTSIPLMVAFIGARGPLPPRRAFGVSLVFALGILTMLAVIGILSAAAGHVFGDVGRPAHYIAALVLLWVGLYLLGVVPLPWPGLGLQRGRRKGLLGAFSLGLLFGLGMGPCAFAFMAPVLLVAFKVGAHNLPYSLSLLLAYSLGYCLVFVLAGTFTDAVQRYLNWTEQSRGSVRLKRVCGLLIVLGALYLLYLAG